MTAQGPDMSKITEHCPEMLKKYTRTQYGVTIDFHDQQAALFKILQIHEKIKPPSMKVEIEGFEELLDKVYGLKE